MASSAKARLWHRIECEAATLNNIILSDLEAQVAKGLLGEAESRLHALDLQIAQLYRQHEKETIRLERLRASVANHKRLPTEILSHIFRLASDGARFAIPQSSSTDVRWVLRQICSRWRLVALSDRRLWNDIAVNLLEEETNPYTTHLGHDNQFSNLKDYECLFRTFVPRTGLISLYLSSHLLPEVTEKAMKIFVEPHAERLTRLHLVLRTEAFSWFFANLPTRFPFLESLDIMFMDLSFQNLIDIQGLPPRLHRLRVSGGRAGFSCLLSPQVDWANVIDIDVSGLIGLNLSYLYFFKRCVALRTLKIMLYRGGTTSEPISLACLSSLTISAESSAVFDALTLPLLKHLHIEDLGKFPIAEITSMITRSQCSLDVLAQSGRDSEAEHCDYDLTAWASLFDVVPSLLELKFQNIIIPKQILERITKAGLLPKLEVLECRIDTNSLHTFLDTITSRSQTTVSGSSLPVFRRALGRYPRSSYISDPDYVKSAENRMESLKQRYNIDIQFWACSE